VTSQSNSTVTSATAVRNLVFMWNNFLAASFLLQLVQGLGSNGDSRGPELRSPSLYVAKPCLCLQICSYLLIHFDEGFSRVYVVPILFVNVH
jgi:hypothetical protein